MNSLRGLETPYPASSRRSLFLLLITVTLGSCAAPSEDRDPVYERVTYEAALDPVSPGHFANPILPGFHPDPSMVRVDSSYYLVTSTFSWLPGLPIYRSTDLVEWNLIGHVIDRPGQVSFDSLRVSEGVFAPTIRHHDGTWYVVVTLVGAGGNAVFTSSDPGGPWSDPVLLPSIDGIDPDLFFASDGRAWIAHNGPPPAEPRWDGHRALWIQEFDPGTLQTVGERTLIVDGGVDPATHPVWIEGPHLFETGDGILMIAAEGGTGENHSEVVFTAPDPRGPYVPLPGNPILTQRDLGPGREWPVTSTGHADMVQTPEGDWWAVFLGTRPYDTEEVLYNLGRETFLLPVTWTDGLPVILPHGTPVPREVPTPNGKSVPPASRFVFTTDFSDGLPADWVALRTQPATLFSIENGELRLPARTSNPASRGEVALLARRQQHAAASFEVSLRYRPEVVGDEAGLILMQQDASWLSLTIARTPDGVETRVTRRFRNELEVLAAIPPPSRDSGRFALGVTVDHGLASFRVAQDPDGVEWITVADSVDATILSTRRAGGFTGTMMGIMAVAGVPE